MKYKLTIEYDGKHYAGWQIQPGQKTIQGEIEKALATILKTPIKVYGAGRTDAGVSAFGQVAHIEMNTQYDISLLRHQLNGILKPYIYISEIALVNDDFDARFSAKWRLYSYWLIKDAHRHPLYYQRALFVKQSLNTVKLMSYLDMFIGTHDFTSFCAAQSSFDNKVRTIEDIYIEETRYLYKVYIKGNAFLRSMIRIMIGTVLHLYKNNDNPKAILSILEKRDRRAAGPTVPAYPLYLEHIHYEEE